VYHFESRVNKLTVQRVENDKDHLCGYLTTFNDEADVIINDQETVTEVESILKLSKSTS